MRPGGTVSGPAMFTLADFAVYVAIIAAMGEAGGPGVVSLEGLFHGVDATLQRGGGQPLLVIVHAGTYTTPGLLQITWAGTEAAPATTTATEAAVARDPRRNLKYFAALPAGVPSWFVERDADGDGQLSLAEFSPKLLKSEIAEFNRHDSNQDGIVTAKELLGSSKDPAAAPAEAPKRGDQ